MSTSNKIRATIYTDYPTPVFVLMFFVALNLDVECLVQYSITYIDISSTRFVTPGHQVQCSVFPKYKDSMGASTTREP